MKRPSHRFNGILAFLKSKFPNIDMVSVHDLKVICRHEFGIPFQYANGLENFFDQASCDSRGEPLILNQLAKAARVQRRVIRHKLVGALVR